MQLVGTMGREFDEAGFVKLVLGSGNDNITINGDFNNDLVVEMDAGGNDTIDASASSSALRIVSDTWGAIDGDVIRGGTTANDTIVLYHDSGAGTTDLSNMSGVENIELNESSGGGVTLLLGSGTTALNITHPTSGGNPFDGGESLTIDGSTYGNAITYSDAGGSGGPNLTLTTAGFKQLCCSS